MRTKTKARQVKDAATAERLLDTAEQLFAEHGFDGVGMRALADEAGVNLGAATYHYGTKEKLYIETFLRRFRPASAARLELLRQAEVAAKGKPVAVETIVDCMLRPPFMTALTHPKFPALMARNLFMPPPFMNVVLESELHPNIEPFVAALTRSLPRLPPDLLRMRVMFSAGAMLMFSGQFGKMPAAMSGDPRFIQCALNELVRFVATGFQSEAAVPARNRPAMKIPLFPPRV